MAERDFLDEVIEERTAQNPDFPLLVEAAERRQRFLRTLAEERAAQDLSQTEVAARMKTSQSSLARLERSASDAKLSTIERMATALGKKVEYRLIDAS